MVQIIQGSDLDFRAAVYGQPHPGALALVKQSTSALSEAFGSMQSTFLDKVHQIAEDYSGSHTLNLMKAALNKLKHAFLPDIIQTYNDIEQLQQAAEKMRYYIMSEPTLLERYRKQEIAGYDGHFVDMYPDCSGWDHPVYQAVHNGLLIEGDEDTEDRVEMFFTDSEDELQIDQQTDIIETQMLSLSYVLYGKRDPTSTFNAKL